MRMTVLLFDGFTALDVVGGYEVLANVPGMTVDFAARDMGVISADTRQLGLLATAPLGDEATSDILYVPGGPGVGAILGDAATLDWVRRSSERSTWTVGICNGVAILAAAGLLAGATVTTNWGWRERVAAYGVKVVAERFHRHGAIITGAGVSASIDAGLFLAGLLAGQQVARLIQLGIEYFPSPPGFARASVEDVPVAERAILLAFERGPALERLATATAWAPGVR